MGSPFLPAIRYRAASASRRVVLVRARIRWRRAASSVIWTWLRGKTATSTQPSSSPSSATSCSTCTGCSLNSGTLTAFSSVTAAEPPGASPMPPRWNTSLRSTRINLGRSWISSTSKRSEPRRRSHERRVRTSSVPSSPPTASGMLSVEESQTSMRTSLTSARLPVMGVSSHTPLRHTRSAKPSSSSSASCPVSNPIPIMSPTRTLARAKASPCSLAAADPSCGPAPATCGLSIAAIFARSSSMVPSNLPGLPGTSGETVIEASPTWRTMYARSLGSLCIRILTRCPAWVRSSTRRTSSGSR